MNDLKNHVKTLPDTPGVYFFKKGDDILYIGKATSLRDRVRSYFAADIREVRSPLIERMVEEATDVDVEETDSVLEALVLESNLIKKHKPPYNTFDKDDKSFNYVGVTKEEYPRVFTVRARELQTRVDTDDFKYLFGPYPQGGSLNTVLKIVRRIFPFRGKKDPLPTESKRKSRLNEELGLAPDLRGDEGKRSYQNTIQNIRLIFEGKKKKLIKKLEKEMKEHAKEQRFEEASHVKKQIFALQHINDIALIKEENTSSTIGFRIEAYDIAHMSGKNMTGVMTVVEDGYPKKSDYRKFRIRSVEGANDTAALREVLERRLNHNEWKLPRVLVVDGGKAQINVAEGVLKEYGYEIPVVSVVKDEYHRPKDILQLSAALRRHERELLLANAEAHRFALAYHDKLRRKI